MQFSREIMRDDSERRLFEEYAIHTWPGIDLGIRSDGMYWENHEDKLQLWRDARSKMPMEQVIVVMDKLTDEERESIMLCYCRKCGSKDTSCPCWRDD